MEKGRLYELYLDMIVWLVFLTSSTNYFFPHSYYYDLNINFMVANSLLWILKEAPLQLGVLNSKHAFFILLPHFAFCVRDMRPHLTHLL